eukprot:gene2865-3312_t
MASMGAINDMLKKNLSEFETPLERSFKVQIESSISSLREEFNGPLKSKFSEVDIKLQSIEKSQQFLGAQYETFRAQIGQVLKQNTDLRNENEKLASRLREFEKKDQIRAKSIDDLKQYGRREMIEIAGIPKTREEDCEKIAITVSAKVGVMINHEDIEAAHRISRREEASIIVKYKSRKVAQQMLSKDVKAEIRKIRISDLGYPMPQRNASNSNIGKIYVNESLTSHLKNLLCLTKIKKRELNYKYVC